MPKMLPPGRIRSLGNMPCPRFAEAAPHATMTR